MPSIEVTTPPDVASAIDSSWKARLKAQLRVSDPTEDPDLLDYLKDAYDDVEALLKRSLLTQTLAVLFDTDEARSPLRLPRPPVRSIASVTTYDTDDQATTVAATEYRLEGEAASTNWVDDAHLVAVGGGWTRERHVAAVRVVYAAGYGAFADVPRRFQRAILRRAHQLYTYREDAIVGTTTNAAPVMTMRDLWADRMGSLVM